MDIAQPQQLKNISDDHVPWLDGLRGFASLWVLIVHVQILSGLKSSLFPIVPWGGLAVDLFMMLSGFLMAHHYILRQKAEPWDHPETIAVFWLRRFFRIAPLYYVLLIAAITLGPLLGEYRAGIAVVWPGTATPAERYFDQSIINVLAHVSFVFGVLPDFAFRTALPDWSIGLEMQFYLVFPIIMLLFSRVGPVKSSVSLVLVCVLFRWYFQDFFSQFQMPSFIPFKLYIFLVGMWIATARKQKNMRQGFFFSVLLTASWILFEKSAESVARVFLVVAMFYIMNNGTLPASRFLKGGIERIRKILSGSLSRFLGDTSYSTYLLHLLIIIPVAGELTCHPQYMGLHPLLRFIVCLFVSVPMVYLLSWILFKTIEQGGIRVGKMVVFILKNRNLIRSTENI